MVKMQASKKNTFSKLEVTYRPIESLIPYARNSRTHSDAQVAQIAASIKEFGWTNPVLIDGEGLIIAGHGRVMAGRKLGIKEAPCIVLNNLTDAQRRAYVIADNKLALNAGWDTELLKVELNDLKGLDFDLNLTGFDPGELKDLLSGSLDGLSDSYTHKVEAPIYEPKGEKPSIVELCDKSRADKLTQEIEKANLPKDVSEFLKAAASRHVVFNYEKIAEFYCHADKQTQELMENSALVIIDFNKAMQLGYVKLKEELAAALKGQASDDGDEDE